MALGARRPTLWFFLIAFGMPWIGWSAIRIFGLQPSPLRTALFYTGDFCSVGGLVAMYLHSGRAGLKGLLRRAVRINVSPLWWLLAIAIPLTLGIGGYLVAGQLRDGVGSIALAGFATYGTRPVLMNFTTGPWGEELGWRGYLTPRLLQSTNALVVSLIVGLLWGIWHVPLYVDSVFSTFGGGALFTLNTMLSSVIMTAILLHTRGSVLIAVLYHWLINATGWVLPHVFVGFGHGAEQIRSSAELGVKVTVVLVLIAVLGKNLTRHPDAPEQIRRWWGGSKDGV